MKSTKKLCLLEEHNCTLDLHEIAIEVYKKIVEMGLNENIT
jgi:hypothetical protein